MWDASVDDYPASYLDLEPHDSGSLNQGEDPVVCLSRQHGQDEEEEADFDIGSSPSINFFLDTLPTPLENFDPDQSVEANHYAFNRAPEPYTAHAADDKRTEKTVDTRACFNCGETGHSFHSCPYARDSVKIRESRHRFAAEKANDESDHDKLCIHGRLHQQAESIQQRLEWLDRYIPGRPSPQLIEALGFIPPASDSGDKQSKVSFRDDGWSSEPEEGEILSSSESLAIEPKTYSVPPLPYLKNMLVWGYPPGWISKTDPVEQIRQRFLFDESWENTALLQGFELEPLKTCTLETPLAVEKTRVGATTKGSKSNFSSAASDDGSVYEMEPKSKSKRWVNFHTDLFDSMKLEPFDVEFRTPLPNFSRDDFDDKEPRLAKRRKRNPETEPQKVLVDRKALWQSLLNQEGQVVIQHCEKKEHEHYYPDDHYRHHYISLPPPLPPPPPFTHDLPPPPPSPPDSPPPLPPPGYSSPPPSPKSDMEVSDQD